MSHLSAVATQDLDPPHPLLPVPGIEKQNAQQDQDGTGCSSDPRSDPEPRTEGTTTTARMPDGAPSHEQRRQSAARAPRSAAPAASAAAGSSVSGRHADPHPAPSSDAPAAAGSGTSHSEPPQASPPRAKRPPRPASAHEATGAVADPAPPPTPDRRADPGTDGAASRRRSGDRRRGEAETSDHRRAPDPPAQQRQQQQQQQQHHHHHHHHRSKSDPEQLPTPSVEERTSAARESSPLPPPSPPRSVPTEPYFAPRRRGRDRPRPALDGPAPSRRVEGTRGNGAMKFCIHTDTPGGHRFPSLVLVRGIETYECDEDGEEEDDVEEKEDADDTDDESAEEEDETFAEQGHFSNIQRPPTPPKPSHKRPMRQRPSQTAAVDKELPAGSPRRSSALSPPEPPQRQASGVPDPDERPAATQAPRSAAPPVDSGIHPACPEARTRHQPPTLQALQQRQRDRERERVPPSPRDSGTLDDTLINSVGSAPIARSTPAAIKGGLHAGKSNGGNHRTTANGIFTNRAEANEDDYDQEEFDENSESSDEADAQVKGYIQNYVQTQYHPRQGTSNSRENSAHEHEDASIDPMSAFAPHQIVANSCADIENSIAVASIDEHSGPSVDYGYNQDIKSQQADSASSFSAKELEPETKEPVLASPVTSISSMRFESSASKKHANAAASKPTRATVEAKPPTSRHNHNDAVSKETSNATTSHPVIADNKAQSHSVRGAKKPVSRVRQPSMIDPQSQPMNSSGTGLKHQRPNMADLQNSLGSGWMHFSRASMGSSGSDSSAFFQSTNPYAVPESVLDQSMAFMQFDFRTEAGVTRCETNEDVQVIDSSEEGSIDEFDARVPQPRNVEAGVSSDTPVGEPMKTSDVHSQHSPPKLPVRNKSNEDLPPHAPQAQKGLRSLVRNLSNRESAGASLGPEVAVSAPVNRGGLIRSLSTDGNVTSPKRTLMRNFSNRHGRSRSSDRANDVRRTGLFRISKAPVEKDATKDLVKKFFNFGNASSSSLVQGNNDAANELMEDEVSLLLDR